MGPGSLLEIILGGIAVILIIVGLTMGFDPIFSIFDTINVDTESMALKCDLLASSGKSGYCSDRIVIAATSFVNCDYAVKNLGVNIESTYGGECDKEIEKFICNKLELEDEDFNANDYKVNKQKCQYWMGLDKDGNPITSTGNCVSTTGKSRYCNDVSLSECTRVEGCEIDTLDSCTGPAVSCSTYAENKCSTQYGCAWTAN